MLAILMLVQLALRDIDEVDDAPGVAELEHDPQLAVLEVGPQAFLPTCSLSHSFRIWIYLFIVAS